MSPSSLIPHPSSLSLTDTHAHLERYADIDKIIQNANHTGVTKIIAVGTDINSSQLAVVLARKYPRVYAAVGIHPHEASKLQAKDLAVLQKLAQLKEVVAIGEAGLDYHYLHSKKEDQRSLFKKQICLANNAGKPLIIHSREAMEDTLSIIEKNKPDKAVFHCYSGDSQTAIKLASQGFYISVTGVITFKNAAELVSVVKEAPLDSIMLETDCPYLSPEPRRGQENQPANLIYTAQKVAEILNLSIEELAELTTNNAQRFFGI
ncbi:MAG: TatD family deoxyribonuclease [Actinobacteria bacterium]|nr:MAG: TatD family deoxyribonuclease [Actinomycetota bacterium]